MQISYRLCPSTMVPSQTTMASRQPSITRFSSSCRYSSRRRGRIRFLNSGSILSSLNPFSSILPPALLRFHGLEGKIGDPVHRIDLSCQMIIEPQIEATDNLRQIAQQGRTIKLYGLVGVKADTGQSNLICRSPNHRLVRAKNGDIKFFRIH